MGRLLTGFAAWAILAAAAIPTPSKSQSKSTGELFQLDPPLEIGARLGVRDRSFGMINVRWANRQADQVIELAKKHIAAHPHSYRGYALHFLAHRELTGNRSGANQVAAAAIKALSAHPTELAEFILRGMLVAPDLSDYQTAQLTLVPLLPDHPKHGALRIAYLCALLGSGKTREAQVTQKNILGFLDDHEQERLTELLCETRNGAAMADVAMQFLDLVRPTRANTAAFRLLEYRVLQELVRDEKRIVAAEKRIVPHLDNDQIWALLTERKTAGKFTRLALRAAQHLEAHGTLGYHEYDTIALAYFRSCELGIPVTRGSGREPASGRFALAKAIELQKKSLAAGGRFQPDYRRRMKHYAAVWQQRQQRKPSSSRRKEDGKPPTEKPPKRR